MKINNEQVTAYTATSAERRIRLLNNQISKAKEQLEALRTRKKLLYAKLRLLRHAFAASKHHQNKVLDDEDDEDISEMIEDLLSIKLDITSGGATVPDDIGIKLINMTLDENKD